MRRRPSASPLARLLRHLLPGLVALGAALGSPLGGAATAAAQASAAQAPDARAPRAPTDLEMLTLLQTMRVVNAPSFAPLINALLGDTAAHMRMAPGRPATAADSARAAEAVRTVRSALARYADVAAAERDGYERFLPWLAEQSVYHYNNVRHAIAAAARTDLARPSSLLYRKDADGRLRLVGAMYTAPAGATPDELDARLPLGIAHWHKHVDFCGPRVDPRTLASQPTDSATLARWLAIDTREACAAAGGVFLPELFGWMAHVNAFDADTPAEIWGGHGRDHMHMHSRPHRHSPAERPR